MIHLKANFLVVNYLAFLLNNFRLLLPAASQRNTSFIFGNNAEVAVDAERTHMGTRCLIPNFILLTLFCS